MSEQTKERRSWIGASLLVIGMAFLYKNFEFYLFDIPDIMYSWKFLLVGIGALLLLLGNRSGIPIILVGLFLIFTNDILSVFRHLDSWWPVILILVGVGLLTRTQYHQQGSRKE